MFQMLAALFPSISQLHVQFQHYAQVHHFMFWTCSFGKGHNLLIEVLLKTIVKSKNRLWELSKGLMKARNKQCNRGPKFHWIIQDLGSQNIVFWFAKRVVTVIQHVHGSSSCSKFWLLNNQAYIMNRKLPMAVFQWCVECCWKIYLSFIYYTVFPFATNFITVFPNRTCSVS